MRTALLVVAVLATTAHAQRTELYNGQARFTEDYQRQLAAEGFRPAANGVYEKVISRNGVPFEESARRFESAQFMGGSSINRFPRNPNPIPAINVGNPRSNSSPYMPPYSDNPDYKPPARPPVDNAGSVGPKGDRGERGPEGPQGPKGDRGESATITSEQLTEIAAIILKRMEADPDKWRGPKGDAGENGKDGTDATLPRQLFVLQFEGAEGVISRSVPVELGGVATIPPVRIQLQNETAEGTVNHVDRSEPLGKPIAIRLPAPKRQ